MEICSLNIMLHTLIPHCDPWSCFLLAQPSCIFLLLSSPVSALQLAWLAPPPPADSYHTACSPQQALWLKWFPQHRIDDFFFIYYRSLIKKPAVICCCVICLVYPRRPIILSRSWQDLVHRGRFSLNSLGSQHQSIEGLLTSLLLTSFEALHRG